MWTSPYPPLPDPPALVPEALAAAAPSDRPAIVDGLTGAVVTRAELPRRSGGVAAALSSRPAAPLALWAPNSPEWVVAAVGALSAAVPVCGISVVATDRELAGLLHRTGAGLLATVPELADRARSVAGAEAVVDLAVLTASAARGHPRAPVPGDIALLPSSSGTTGPAKSVVVTHGNLAAAVGQLQQGIRFTEHDVVLALAPFPHVLGCVVTMAAPLAAGATVVTLPRFSLGALLDAVERYRITVLAVPPPVLAALASAPEVLRRDLSSLDFVVAGGAPVAPALQAAASARLPGAVVAQGYGMTETTAVIPVPDRQRGTPPGSVGRPASGSELRIVDPDTGRDLDDGEEGELWVRGPQVSPGYLGDPAATAELFAAGGWLRTGDVGRMDGGDLRLTGRIKELIKVDGLQVAPAELEALLVSHPAVADAAVVGRPDERHGEVPIAVVVPRGPFDPVAVGSWLAGQVSPHKRLRGFQVVDAIPRTPSGKILRRLLVEEESAVGV